MNLKFAPVVLMTTILGIALCCAVDAQARGRGRGGNGQAQMRQQMISQATQTLNYNRQVLAEAEVVINENSNTVSSQNERIEGARKTISDARSTVHESAKSQRTIEAEILTAQGDDSEYTKANLAFTEAQQTLTNERERILTGDAYLKQKTALMSESGSASKVAKLRHEALENDDAYQTANDRFKSATLVYNRIRSELFKANSDWVAASQAAREAHTEESKANGEATRGAMKKMPAARNLREANEIAAEARMNIAQAESVLRSMNVKIPAAPAGMGYTAGGSSGSGR